MPWVSNTPSAQHLWVWFSALEYQSLREKIRVRRRKKNDKIIKWIMKKNQCERSVNKFKYDNEYESHTLLYIEKTAETDHWSCNLQLCFPTSFNDTKPEMCSNLYCTSLKRDSFCLVYGYDYGSRNIESNFEILESFVISGECTNKM